MQANAGHEETLFDQNLVSLDELHTVVHYH